MTTASPLDLARQRLSAPAKPMITPPAQPSLVTGGALPTPPLLPATGGLSAPAPGRPTSITPPPPAAAPGAPITDFGPGNDLRFSQVNPTASGRLTNLADLSTGAATKIGQGPSLSDAASKQFDLLGQQSAEQRKLGIQDIGRSAATFGRLGSGKVTTDLGNLEDVLRTREEQARAGLSAQTAIGEGENRRADLASLYGLESGVAGQEAAKRGEVRGERGYQTDTAQQTLDNQVKQKALEDALLNSQYGRAATEAGVGLAGGQLKLGQGAAAAGGASDLLSQLSLEDYLKKLKANQFTQV